MFLVIKIFNNNRERLLITYCEPGTALNVPQTLPSWILEGPCEECIAQSQCTKGNRGLQVELICQVSCSDSRGHAVSPSCLTPNFMALRMYEDTVTMWHVHFFKPQNGKAHRAWAWCSLAPGPLWFQASTIPYLIKYKTGQMAKVVGSTPWSFKVFRSLLCWVASGKLKANTPDQSSWCNKRNSTNGSRVLGVLLHLIPYRHRYKPWMKSNYLYFIGNRLQKWNDLSKVTSLQCDRVCIRPIFCLSCDSLRSEACFDSFVFLALTTVPGTE